MTLTMATVVAVVVVALVFAWTNGFHDAANAIATSVSTRALTPRVALLLAAVMNFVGAFLGQQIAETVATVVTFPAEMLADDPVHALAVVLSGLLGAIVWNVATWWLGLPSSSTHALIGGLGGAALVGGVTVEWDIVRDQVLVPMLLAPLLAFAAAYAVMVGLMWAFRHAHPARANRGFRVAQTVSAAAMALGHGLQDAQKTMGVIVLALVVGGYQAPLEDGGGVPLWVVVGAATAIALGTFSGGWRIVRTLGRRIIDLDPPRGFAAETVAASVLYTTAYVYEAPISTTHTITSAVVGVGASKRLSAVRWRVVRRIAAAWLLTFPMAAAAAAGCYVVVRLVVEGH